MARHRQSIRDIYHTNKRVEPADAFVAVQSGEFVHFCYSQAEAISRAMPEYRLDDSLGYPCVRLHVALFEDFVRRLQILLPRPVKWMERTEMMGGVGVRTVAVIRPPAPRP